MRKLACPDGQIDMFPPQVMAEVFAHPAPDAPLPPLPFERNEEVDIDRAAKILHVDDRTIRRMLQRNPPLLRGYKPMNHRSVYRIEYASIVEHCDNLRKINNLPPRKQAGKRIPDDAILPFPWKQTILLADVAKHLDILVTTATELISSGELDAYQIAPFTNGPWRIYRPSFVRYVEKLRRQAGLRTPA